MKKEDITLIRVLTVAVLLALQFLLLITVLRYGIFNKVLLKCADSNLGDYFYFTNINTFYSYFNLLTVVLLSASVFGIMFKINKSGICAYFASMLSFGLSIFLLIATIGERIIPIKAAIIKISMSEYPKESITKSGYLSLYLLFAIVLLVISLLTLTMIKKSNINRIKIYNNKSKVSLLNSILPGIIIYFVINSLRSRILTIILNNRSVSAIVSYTGFRTHFLDNLHFLAGNIIVLAGSFLICEIVRLYYDRISEKVKLLICVACPIVINAVFVMSYYFNPPQILGSISFDLDVCNMIDDAFLWYLLYFLFNVALLCIFNYFIIIRNTEFKKVLISLCVACILSILFMFIFAKTPAVGFAGWLICDFISFVVFLYLIRYSNYKR